MRDLKFRAWRKDNDPRMIEWRYILLAGLKTYLNDDYALMQYTGLLDKQSKEIYESDRVRTPAGIGIVKWDRCFRLFWNDKDSTTLHDCQEKNLEVIGNIYENPNLLVKIGGVS